MGSGTAGLNRYADQVPGTLPSILLQGERRGEIARSRGKASVAAGTDTTGNHRERTTAVQANRKSSRSLSPDTLRGLGFWAKGSLSDLPQVLRWGAHTDTHAISPRVYRGAD